MTPLLLALCVLSAAPAAPEEALAQGADWYRRRAEGARGPLADPAPIEAAIAAYRRALLAAPGSIPASVGLLRSLFFRGGFTGADADTQREVFSEARDAAVAAVEGLEEGLGKPRGEARLAALRGVPDAAALYLWAGVSWGQWALSTSKLSAARQGAAGKIRDLGETSLALDPVLEQGTAHVLLGRLHDQSPRIPFLTFWISRDAALQHFDAAHALSPHNPLAEYFLAEAILRRVPARRAEALRLLGDCAASQPRPEYAVEDAHYAGRARRRLAELQGR